LCLNIMLRPDCTSSRCSDECCAYPSHTHCDLLGSKGGDFLVNYVSYVAARHL
jgi:hypothetical protein